MLGKIHVLCNPNYCIKLATKKKINYFAHSFIFLKDSVMYAIESSLPSSGLGIFNMDAVSGKITTKASFQSGSNYFYQVNF